MSLKPETVCRKHAANPGPAAKAAKAALARIRRRVARKALKRGEEPPSVRTKGWTD